MSRILLLNKPYDVLCQFTDSEGRHTLAELISEKGLYPAGRLDRDSEGMVLLTDDGALQHCIAHPKHKMPKTYWVQVEGEPDDAALQRLRNGVELKDGQKTTDKGLKPTVFFHVVADEVGDYCLFRCQIVQSFVSVQAINQLSLPPDEGDTLATRLR